ncbi:hemolysin III family protein [Permianibacter sp. IMCC34836]|uniref:PAQR family membrane homeostasis protein TrhA n=1 Tax=Permianibacter fluminis TaxID=2738515 RepID=UPI0015571AFB|nr:hemolysin III family protein [Permianibacter fluminis]NQD37840.1 hemolysin III family protein [Permianibacter fluminis]
MTTEAVARYSSSEELANAITHGLGIVLSIAALAILTGFASAYGEARHVIGVSVFGASLVLLYTASTLYHSIPSPRAKEVLRALDHSFIFVLIAGTYTPFCLVTLQGVWGWGLFAFVWSLAVIGIICRLWLGRKSGTASVIVYLLMGWSIVPAFKPLMASISSLGLWLMVAGGIAYTGGVVFYVWRKLTYHHAIWHLFVLAGSMLHFFAILLAVVPGARETLAALC